MTFADGPPAPGRLRRRRSPRTAVPTRRGPDPLVDAAAAFTLAVLAVVGLHNVTTGWAYLLVGMVGAGLAAAVVLGLRALGSTDPLVTVVALLVAFPLGAGLATADRSGGTGLIAGLVPTPEAVGRLVTGLVNAWKELVTTAAPVGLDLGLGVVPYTMGFVACAGALVLARRSPSPLAPAAPALAILLLGFLLGTAEPVSLLLQGAAVVAVALGWGAVRGNRPRRVAGPPHWQRLVSGVAMLAVVCLVGLVIGSHLPVASRGTRLILREVEPPFDPRRDPSPLIDYHDHVVGPARDDVLMTVSGLPRDGRLRLATLDTYDGVVWKVGGAEGPATGRYEKVGETILPVPPGQPATVEVRIERDRGDMWVPTAGATRAVRFAGDRARQLAASFRYNRTTQTGAVPDRLLAGDRYTLDAQLPPPVDEDLARSRAPLGADQLPPVPPLPESLAKRATALTVDAPTGYDKARTLATALHNGTGAMPTFYSDGGAGTEGTASASPSGHSFGRLVRFVDARNGLVGNAEQYAATMALMARMLGLPAQVVLGFRPPADAPVVDGAQVIRAADIDAWVEVAFDGIGWLPFDPTPPRDRRPDDSPTVSQREVDLSQQEPPPPTYLEVPDSLPDLVARPPEAPPPPESALESASGLLRGILVLTAPLWLVLAVAALVVGAKLQRARRRRRRGPPTQRLAGAWWEVCDRARDLGAPIPLRATRLEIARTIAPVFPGAPPLAVRIDEAMFAAPLPSDHDVTAIWERLDAEHRTVVRRLGWWPRVRVALNVASLRPRRWYR